MTAAHSVLVRGLPTLLWVVLAAAGCGRTTLDTYDDGGPVRDAGRDSGIDAGRDSGVDAGRDSGIDAGRDSGIDAGRDSGFDGGLCRFGCNDGIDCTDDFCDPATGACSSVPNPFFCGPSQMCVPGLGCRAVPCRANEVCADGFFCNGAERCVNGFCQSGTPVQCASSTCQVNRCDEFTRNCVGTWRDDDNDGFPPFECMGGDCDDQNARIFPGAREVCTDGRDNDCDFVLDCADDECRNDATCNPPPPRETNCRNGLDDDFDGRIDCADSDCFNRPVCQPQPEVCDDGRDNDGDNATDCDDSDCANDARCMVDTCPMIQLGSRIGEVARGNTNRGTNLRSPSCTGSNSAPEVTHRWRVPESGTWTFDTFGSGRDYDPVLYVLSGSCAGQQIACNDDFTAFQSRITLDLTSGQILVIVVDGFSSSSGDYVLNINRGGAREAGFCTDGFDNDSDGFVDCADSDCLSDPSCRMMFSERGFCTDGFDNDFNGLTDCADTECFDDPFCVVMPECPNLDLGRATGSVVASGNTLNGVNNLVPGCAFSNAPEITYRWRAPATGTWEIDTVGSTFDAILYLLNRTCDGGQIACNDDTIGRQARVSVTLAAGEQVVIVVDGWSSSAGNYVLNINQRNTNESGFCADGFDNDSDGAIDCDDGDCIADMNCVTPDCPDAELGSLVGRPVIADSTLGQGNDFTPSCLASASNAPDVAYRWRAPRAGTWTFDTAGSAYDTALSVLNGGCNGTTLACNDDASGTRSSSVSVTLRSGQVVVVVVDGYSRGAGNYVLNISGDITDERGLCADLIDNDGDGSVDCFDPDCFSDPACVPACDPREAGVFACIDGRDNDCDMRVDCDDPDCRFGAECCNGGDDDGDGLVDLLACSCETAADCPPLESPIGVVPSACWPRFNKCGPDCSSFGGGLADIVCQFINPGWRCQRSTGQCVPAPQP